MAVHTDGTSSDFVTLSTQLVTAAAHIVSFWYRNSTNDLEPIYVHRLDNDNRIEIASQVTTGFVQLVHAAGGGVPSSIVGTIDISDGNWHHICYTTRATNDHELYIDGVSDGTTSTNLTANFTPTIHHLGRHASIYGEGEFANIGVWDNKGFTTAEALALKNSNPLAFVDSNLKNYDPLFDLSADGRIGTVSFTGCDAVAHPPVAYYPGVKVAGTTGGQIFFQALVGALSFSGIVSTLQTFVKALTGALSFSGTLSSLKLFVKALSGALSFSGTLNSLQTFVKALIGVLSFSGKMTPFKFITPKYLKDKFEAIIIKILDS